MNKAAIVGVGHSKFGVRRDASLRELAFEAVRECLSDANLSLSEIDASVTGVCISELAREVNPSFPIADYIGMNPKPDFRVASACATGSAAIRTAWMGISSGLYDVVLVIGAEKMTESPTPVVTEVMGRGGDVQWEYAYGTTFPGYYAMMANRHMHEFGTTHEQLAMVAVKNHRNALDNPYAQFRKEINVEKVLGSPMVAYPLTLFDCCPLTDGAAAVILASEEKARKITDTPIWLVGLGLATDSHTLSNRETLVGIPASTIAFKQASKMANVTHKDIDVVEVHDCFTIAEIMAYEDLGFCEKGEGGKLIEEGVTEIGGEIPVNTDGGLKAKGHPVGATGVSQTVEITKQLRGEAGKRQVEGAEVGLSHNVGSSGQSVFVHIYRR